MPGRQRRPLPCPERVGTVVERIHHDRELDAVAAQCPATEIAVDGDLAERRQLIGDMLGEAAGSAHAGRKNPVMSASRPSRWSAVLTPAMAGSPCSPSWVHRASDRSWCSTTSSMRNRLPG